MTKLKKAIDYATATAYVLNLTVGMYGYMTENLAIVIPCFAIHVPLQLLHVLYVGGSE